VALFAGMISCEALAVHGYEPCQLRHPCPKLLHLSYPATIPHIYINTPATAIRAARTFANCKDIPAVLFYFAWASAFPAWLQFTHRHSPILFEGIAGHFQIYP
jgi:hypothetical protein